MSRFEKSSVFESNVESLFDYHANPGALDRLIPPWDKVAIEKRSDSIAIGSEVVIRSQLGPISIRWVARHTELQAPYLFGDIQVSGPFASWHHRHLFQSIDAGNSKLTDHIDYKLKFGSVGQLASSFVEHQLSSMFEYRHTTTRADLRLMQWMDHARAITDSPIRIGVTGSSGMIGRRLVGLISVLGFQPIRIIRSNSPRADSRFPLNAKTVVWDSKSGFTDSQLVNGLDAVIHLGGKSIASARWSDSVKREILDSRVAQTTAIVGDLARLPCPPRTFVSASAVGIYGDRGDTALAEHEPPGNDFLADVATRWEAAAMNYQSVGRVALGRLGIVIHPREGALAKMLTPFKLGLGGPIGPGTQYWSWIHIDDAIGALLYLALGTGCSGAYNLVAPQEVTNSDFTRALASVLNRPALIPAPSWGVRLALGEMADALLLTSTRARCDRLMADGFPFRCPELAGCLRNLLGR